MKRPAHLVVAVLLLPWLTAWSLPWTAGRLSRDGREAWRRGDWARSRSAYEAAQRAGGEQPELLYNLGTSQLAAGDALAAAETLGKVRTSDRALGAKAHYNRGNALFELGSLEAAAKAYEEALRLDPGDADARHNLDVCRRRLAAKPPKPEDPPKQDPPPQPDPADAPRPQAGASQAEGEPPQEPEDDPQATARKLSQLDADERTDRELLRLRPRGAGGGPDGSAAREADDADRQFRGLYGSSDRQDW